MIGLIELLQGGPSDLGMPPDTSPEDRQHRDAPRGRARGGLTALSPASTRLHTTGLMITVLAQAVGGGGDGVPSPCAGATLPSRNRLNTENAKVSEKLTIMLYYQRSGFSFLTEECPIQGFNRRHCFGGSNFP
jgi:hypothetical protein